MTVFEAVSSAIVPGLTEFLPVSNSGPIEVGSYLPGAQSRDNCYSRAYCPEKR